LTFQAKWQAGVRVNGGGICSKLVLSIQFLENGVATVIKWKAVILNR
jgi:hypothetical protein